MEERFVSGRFARYYSGVSPRLQPNASSREWGFGGWEKKIESRHMKFSTTEELYAYLRRNSPLYVSHSAAYYEYPDGRPMEKKNWLGADLIFDIDADQLNPPCSEKHGKGWVCDTCLSMSKLEAQKLVEEFLETEFGFARGSIGINFSGNRGYHVHVVDDEVKALSSAQRREISDYITGKGLSPGSFYEMRRTMDSRLGSSLERLAGPKLSDSGWRGRIARAFTESVRGKKLGELGMNERLAKRFYSKEKEVLAGLEHGNWDIVGVKDKEKFWGEIARKQSINLGDNIDQNVTFDTSKLIRMPDSLHGETGLLAKRTTDPEKFDPLKDAVVFGKTPVRVKIEKAPEIRIWDEVFGPFSNFEGELPEAVAIYYICKKRAKLG